MPDRFDFTHAPLPQYAQLAAALELTARPTKCRNRKRARFFCRTMIALTRRRIWASMTPNPCVASTVQRRKCDIQPVRYRLISTMQALTERPQFGGVIARIVSITRCFAFREGKMATMSPLSPSCSES